MNLSAKQLSWLVLAMSILSLIFQAVGLFLPLRILAFAVLAVTIIITALSQWQAQKGEREAQRQRDQDRRDAAKRDSVRNYESIFAPYQRAQQQTPPKGKTP